MKKYGAIILIGGIIIYLSFMLLLAQENSVNKGQRGQSGQRDRYGPLDPGNAGTEPANQKTVETPKVETPKMDFNGSEGGGEDMEDENYFADDREIFSRKLFQKKLAPLSNKEKIIWAFRLSRATIFL